MKTLRLLGATCALSLVPTISAQDFVDGTMQFWILDAHWALLGCSFTPETDSPIGFVLANGTTQVATATSNGDHCEASGTARDTVAGGSRLTLTATAMGVHVCEWEHVDDELGEVELLQSVAANGTVIVQNLNAAAAALGWAEASSNIAPAILAVLTTSAGSTVAGALGNLSAAYDGITPQTPVVSLGAGTYTDNDADTLIALECTDYLWVQHRSRAFIKVLALKATNSPGDALGTGSMSGDCYTDAFLLHCPH